MTNPGLIDHSMYLIVLLHVTLINLFFVSTVPFVLFSGNNNVVITGRSKVKSDDNTGTLGILCEKGMSIFSSLNYDNNNHNQWRIQDLPEGASTPGGANLSFG